MAPKGKKKGKKVKEKEEEEAPPGPPVVVGPLVQGPPFDPRCYLVTPSTTESGSPPPSPPPLAGLTLPRDIHFDSGPILDPHAALRKVQELMRDKHGCRSYGRQASLLCAFVKATPTGFALDDIPVLIEVMEHLLRNSEEVPEYTELLRLVLTVAGAPPRMVRSSDGPRCHEDLVHYFTLYAELLATLQQQEDQRRVVEIVQGLVTRCPQPLPIDCVKLPQRHAAVEASQLPRVVALLLECLPPRLYTLYLELSLTLLQVSRRVRETFIENSVLEAVLWRLDPSYTLSDPHRPPADLPLAADRSAEDAHYHDLECAMEVVWVILDTMSDGECFGEPPSQNALWSLRLALHREARKGTAKARCARNGLLGVAIKLYQVFGHRLQFIQGGLAVDVAMLAVATELGAGSWALGLEFGTSEDDFELKTLSLAGCCMLSRHNAMLVLREGKVLEGVLELVNPNLTVPTVSWSPGQFASLLSTALVLVAELAPRMPDVFVKSKGSIRLLLLLEWCQESPLDKKPLLQALQALCAVTTCRHNAAILEDLRDRDAVDCLLKLGLYIVSKPVLVREDHQQLSHLFLSLEQLGRLGRLGRHGGLSPGQGAAALLLAVHLLRRVVRNAPTDSLLDGRLLVCFASFLWTVVAQSPGGQQELVAQGGVAMLLDLIERSCYPVQVMLLGVLVDVVDRSDPVCQLVEWRGADCHGLLGLLVRVWRGEEAALQVLRSDRGVVSALGLGLMGFNPGADAARSAGDDTAMVRPLADMRRPLMTEEQWYHTSDRRNTLRSSPTAVEMFANARPKIHALYELMKKRCLGVAGEMLGSMDPSDQVCVPLIENFLALKLGEAWLEVFQDETTSYEFFSLCFDDYMARLLLNQRTQWICRVKTVQEEVLSCLEAEEVGKEKELLRLMNSCRLGRSLEALRGLEYLARTTFHKFLQEEKEKQKGEVEKTLEVPWVGELHRTFLTNTNVSYMCGKTVWIQSEPERYLAADLIKPVSTAASDCGLEY